MADKTAAAQPGERDLEGLASVDAWRSPDPGAKGFIQQHLSLRDEKMTFLRSQKHLDDTPMTSSGGVGNAFCQSADARSPGIQGDSAQSLIEVALMMPLFILLFFFAVDYGYFFIVAASLTSSARNGVEYSVQGVSSAAQAPLPPAGGISASNSVAALAVADISGFINASTSTSVFVCSGSIGTNANYTSKCASYGSSTLSYTADIDPESSMFQLNRVDVVYTVTPPIPLTFLPAGMTPPAMTFHRMAEMREIN